MINTINTSKQKRAMPLNWNAKKRAKVSWERVPFEMIHSQQQQHSATRFDSFRFHQVLHTCFSIHLNMPHILNSCLHERGRRWGSIRDNQTQGQQKNNPQHPLQSKNSSAEQLACYMHLLPTLLCPGAWQAKNHNMRLMHYSCSLLTVPT